MPPVFLNRHIFHIGGDLFNQPGPTKFDCLTHGIHGRSFIGRPMRLDNRMRNTKERCTANLILIEQTTEVIQAPSDQQITQFGAN